MFSKLCSIGLNQVIGGTSHPQCLCTASCFIFQQKPGYGAEMKPASLSAYEYPSGSAWQKLFDEGKYERP